MSLEKLTFSLLFKTTISYLKGYKISIFKLNAYNIFSKVWPLKHFWILFHKIPVTVLTIVI